MNIFQNDLIDISLPLLPDLPAWPGSSGFRLEHTARIASGDPANISRFECDVHFGTHIDAPSHFLEGGITVDQLTLETLIGPATVAFIPDCHMITAKQLDAINFTNDTKRLLLRTANSLLWARSENEFRRDYVALTKDAAIWIVEREIQLLGVDYLSVQRFDDGPEVHQILLKAGVVLLEGLNLDGVLPGTYELISFPLNLIGAEGAPARAVLRRISGSPPKGGCK